MVFYKFSLFELTLIFCLQGSNLQFELDSLHGQATVLAALVSISPKLPLGYPARFIVFPLVFLHFVFYFLISYLYICFCTAKLMNSFPLCIYSVTEPLL